MHVNNKYIFSYRHWTRVYIMDYWYGAVYYEIKQNACLLCVWQIVRIFSNTAKYTSQYIA